MRDGSEDGETVVEGIQLSDSTMTLATPSKDTLQVPPGLLVESIAQQLNCAQQPTSIKDPLDKLVQSLESIRQACTEALRERNTFHFWHGLLYPCIADYVKSVVDETPTCDAIDTIKTKFPGLLGSTTWRNICDRYCRGTKDPTRRSNDLLRRVAKINEFYSSLD